jgi:hypothetical protein
MAKINIGIPTKRPLSLGSAISPSSTMAGAAESPVAMPVKDRPTRIVAYDWEKDMHNQPAMPGIILTSKVVRRPIRSIIGPESSEPIGVIMEWTLAAK